MNSALIIGLVLMVFIFILLGIPVYISLGLSGFFSLLLLSITKNTPLALGVMCSSVYTGVPEALHDPHILPRNPDHVRSE